MVINPVREKGDPALPAAGLFVINPTDAQTALRLAKSRNGRVHFLFNSNLMLVPASHPAGTYFVAGPAVGAPMAGLTLEKLIALGAEKIIVYGWCGSITASLRIGDILLPTWAVSTEGTSAHYPLNRRPESHKATRQILSEELLAQRLTVHSGPVWTTDAPYRESMLQVTKLKKEGILGVDMEFGALAAVAAFRKAELTAVFLVSDELGSGTWNPGFRSRNFKKKSGEILHVLIDFCSKLSLRS